MATNGNVSYMEKARRLIHSDALKDSHIIAERQKDRSTFLNQSNSLIGDGFDTMVDTYASSANNLNQGKINEEIGQSGIEYDNMLNNRLSQLKNKITAQRQTASASQLIQEQKKSNGMNNSSLPKEILESFTKNPLELKTPSVLDNIDTSDVHKTAISETNGLLPNNGIDYKLIEGIVEKTVKKYAVALNKKIISEGKDQNANLNELKAMKIGNKFSFISENGDIYEAKLIYKGNIRNKKTK